MPKTYRERIDGISDEIDNVGEAYNTLTPLLTKKPKPDTALQAAILTTNIAIFAILKVIADMLLEGLPYGAEQKDNQ